MVTWYELKLIGFQKIGIQLIEKGKHFSHSNPLGKILC